MALPGSVQIPFLMYNIHCYILQCSIQNILNLAADVSDDIGIYGNRIPIS